MQLGVFLKLFRTRSLEDALAHAASQGIQSVEIATGGYVGNHHLKPKDVLGNQQEIDKIKRAVEQNGLTISALSCHGNPLHPNAAIAQEHHEDFINSILLAKELGVDTVVNFSGCPGESETSQRSVWITCPWPTDFLETLTWQWEEKVIPYWEKMGQFAREQGIKIAVEPHPGFVVYNTETAIRLCEAAGDNVGVNFDPSHLFWQGMDPVLSILHLGSRIYHFHAKDTSIYKHNNDLNGVLDTKSYRDIANRSWAFRTVGYGHGAELWKEIVSALRTVGYDGAISIEHEDGLMSTQEGFSKAVHFLKDVLITEDSGEMYWAR
ncbi:MULTISPECIES: sugar phosphate isomerase/epimerase family protein [Paenibacillus]|uniref:Sugar phosphate isomerase/epimerase n=1 Tax=Paenibacillus radicis (ex Xue et al. 2023) TaxID=2972489 RepID=A0ABT1YIP0_9BACL|nr:sugar phosphate isomerase/epimerase [Paenibacillus radicis (ex Xue et al. 2023)]MCR8632294.1 sugar phosphate isomerase/epimerase [Paenibacillus radicis (ex Xue et al. 2023)]